MALSAVTMMHKQCGFLHISVHVWCTNVWLKFKTLGVSTALHLESSISFKGFLRKQWNVSTKQRKRIKIKYQIYKIIRVGNWFKITWSIDKSYEGDNENGGNHCQKINFGIHLMLIFKIWKLYSIIV